MNKEKLLNIISTEIQAAANEYLKDLSAQKRAQATNEYVNSKNINDDELELTLFHGGVQPEDKSKKLVPITLRESIESNLKITTGEIKKFESSFGEILDNIPGASIVFDKQKNGYSIIATKRADGVEAKASGIINLGDSGKLIWSYSILNGFNLNAQNLKLNQGNKTMFEALSNHYDDWQKEWREKLNLPGAVEPTSDGGMTPASQTLPGADMVPPDQSAPPVSGGAGAPATGM